MIVAIGGTQFAVPMASVVEVVGLGHVTPVPRGPRALVGLMHLRGQIVFVVDVLTALGQDELQRALLPDEPLLVVRGQDSLIGLRVDEVLGPTAREHDATPVDIDTLLLRLSEE